MKFNFKFVPLFFLVVFSLSSVSLFSRAQAQTDEEEARRKIYEEYGGGKVPEEADSSELEKSMNDTVQSLQVSNSDKSKKQEQPDSFYKPRDLKNSYITEMMDKVMKDFVKDLLRENPISKMTEGQVRSLIEGYANNLPIGKFFERNPNSLNFLITWLRDKRAMPKLVGVINKPDKVKVYGIITIIVLVISFFLNLFNSKGNIFKRIIKKIMILIGVGTVNLTVFYFMFTPNIQPTIDIALRFIHL